MTKGNLRKDNTLGMKLMNYGGGTEVVSSSELRELDLGLIVEQVGSDFDKMSGKKLLITGGGGFLGYYLVQAPLYWNEQNADRPPIDVTVYDNFMRGCPDWLTDLESNPNLTLVRHDVIDPLPVDMPDFSFIIHAAGIASPIYYRRYPIKCMDANINGLRNLLEYSVAAKNSGTPVEAFMFYSSSEIYGDPTPENIPTSEDYRGNVSCTGPRACYDESKRYGETLCVNFAQQHDIQVTVARPFNNYGPGLKITDRRVLPDFARNILAGNNIEMLSDGAPTRTFCYSADAISGYYKVLLRGQSGESYNIGTEKPEISIRELANRVTDIGRRMFGYEGQVTFQNSDDEAYLVDNPQRRCPKIDKARSHLDYDPQIDIDTGLERAIAWYYHNPVAADA
jgi:nucleoside-diphosphate-sugar epimerase